MRTTSASDWSAVALGLLGVGHNDRDLGERLRSPAAWQALRFDDQVAVIESSDGQALLHRAHARGVRVRELMTQQKQNEGAKNLGAVRDLVAQMDDDEVAALMNEMFILGKHLGERLRDAQSWHDLRDEDQHLVLESRAVVALLRERYELARRKHVQSRQEPRDAEPRTEYAAD